MRNNVKGSQDSEMRDTLEEYGNIMRRHHGVGKGHGMEEENEMAQWKEEGDQGGDAMDPNDQKMGSDDAEIKDQQVEAERGHQREEAGRATYWVGRRGQAARRRRGHTLGKRPRNNSRGGRLRGRCWRLALDEEVDFGSEGRRQRQG